MRAVWVLLLAGCGRLGFDPLRDAGASDSDSATSMQVCSVDHIELTGVPSDADLVVARLVAGGYAAAWVNTQAFQLVNLLRLDEQRAAIGPPRNPFTAGTAAVSIDDLSSALYFITASPGVHDHYSLSHDLTTHTYQNTLAGLIARDCVSGSMPAPRVTMTANATVINLMAVNASGVGGSVGSFDTGSTVTEVACNDGPDHAHVAWSNATGCHGARINLTSPPAPGGMVSFSDERCLSPRATAGMDALDAGAVIWVTPSGRIVSKHLDDLGTIDLELTSAGRSPRISFDGTRYWSAWIDTESGSDELTGAWFDPSGTKFRFSLAGWRPAGDEAFELVRDGADAYLVVLEATGLSFLRLCPG